MVTDDERREVASNLRLLEPSVFDDGEFYDSWEVLDAIDVASDDGAWYEAAGVRRLADLIEPSCDRDALLEEAKELEKCAWYFGLDFDDNEPLRDRLKEASEDFTESARRIREACGDEGR